MDLQKKQKIKNLIGDASFSQLQGQPFYAHDLSERKDTGAFVLCLK